MIKLMDLIRLAGVMMGKYKIHFATEASTSPLDAYYAGTFKRWQEEQTKRNFQCDRIVSLINLGADKWLFAGVYNILGVQPKKGYFLYSTSEVRDLEHLTGRAVIVFPKKFRASYLLGENYGESLLVHEIKPEKLSIADFPGYNRVLLDYLNLKTIVRREPQSWKTALCHVSGIYLIADVKTGKQYVGSAYGASGLWQRWCRYADTGHGGNKELKALIHKKGKNYSANFRFTILEVMDINASNEYHLEREGHWKSVLLTREYGYNWN